MCGRFTLTAPAAQIASMFNVDMPDTIEPRHNIAPTQEVWTVRLTEHGRAAAPMRWGLVPFWAKDTSLASHCINARGESAHEKASFREPLKRRRCLIPASGFFEWRGTGKHKVPMYIHFKDNLGAFAGLWDAWTQPDGTTLHSCTILTTEPNRLVAPLHDRMPVALAPEAFETWLSPDVPVSQARELFVPAADNLFEVWEVSTRVNNVHNDESSLLEPQPTLL